MHNFQFRTECIDGRYIHSAEGVSGFYIKFMALLGKQPEYSGAGLKTVCVPLAYKCRGSKKHMDTFKSAEIIPGRGIYS